VAIVTASTPLTASTSGIDVNERAMSNRCARAEVLPASRPTMAFTSKPAARSARTWVRQPNPVPTTATPTVIDGLLA
jgi:hypothetical protein